MYTYFFDMMTLKLCIFFNSMIQPREAEEPDRKPPVFDLLPEVVQVEEGETAKFMVKVSGNPRPRVTWWLNGTIVVNVSILDSAEFESSIRSLSFVHYDGANGH